MWHAKPYGAYAIDSTEAKDNMDEIYAQLHNEGWTIEAICGMLGNMVAESGLNPWRWQDDSVSLTSDLKGYGLPQFTPAYGYIYDYGVGVTGYSPNLSVTEETSGATADDGYVTVPFIIAPSAIEMLPAEMLISPSIMALPPIVKFEAKT